MNTLAASLALGGLLMAPAGAPRPPAFEAASVKPFTPASGAWCQGLPQTDPQRFTTCATLRYLIATAYGLADYQLAGGLPDWGSRDLYMIKASTAEPTTPDQMLLMLRGLLGERFGLRLASESKVTPVLALVVAKGGPKFRELGEGESALPPLPPPGKSYLGPVDRFSGLIFLLNMPFARRVLGRIVVDQTGLAGRYGLWATLDSDQITVGGREGIASHYEEIPDALKKIGLELKPANLPVEFYRVQNAHRPTPD